MKLAAHRWHGSCSACPPMTRPTHIVLIVAGAIAPGCKETKSTAPEADPGPSGAGLGGASGSTADAAGSGGSRTAPPAAGTGGTGTGRNAGGTAAAGAGNLEDAGAGVPPHHLGKPFQ